MVGVISMSGKEIDRVGIISRVSKREMRQKTAGERLGLSVRQVQRLVERYRQNGAAGLVSKKRGKIGNRVLPPKLKRETLDWIRKRYVDFGPTLACEKLREVHDIRIGVETLRQWMIEAEIWIPKNAKERQIHQPRRRRPCRGELIQIDGSPHDWFEGRGPKCTLLVYIDDATSEIGELRFVKSESAFDYFEATKNYLKRHGRPVAFYSDKHSIFRKSRKNDKEFGGDTQFGRVLREFNIDIICANTPQAKGRVERANLTLQDRLVKELRLEGINSIEEGNAFVERYLEMFNKKFGKRPASDIDAHRPLRESDDLDHTFCWRERRKLTKNLVLHYKRVMYLVDPTPKTKQLANNKVDVHEWADGTVELWCQDQKLNYSIYDKNPRVAGDIVENKRLGTILSFCKEQQNKQEDELLASKKLTLREKDRLRERKQQGQVV